MVAEDTRRTRALLSHFGIQARLQALHAHNEQQLTPVVLDRLRQGLAVALVSDAGMPLLADPGFPLVRAVREAGLALAVVPGPTALTAALAIAGLPVDRFVFDGFLPARATARRQQLAALRAEPRTLVFYESPHRLAATLADVAAVIGPDRPLRLARELTKRFESVYAGSAAEMAQWAAGSGVDRKGEFVVLIAGNPSPEPGVELAAEQVLRELLAYLPPRQAAKVAARLTGGKVNALYQQAEGLRASLGEDS